MTKESNIQNTLQEEFAQGKEKQQVFSKRPLRRRTLEQKRIKFAWTVLIPMLIYYTILGILPILMVIGFSFVEWNGVYFNEIQWIGFDNFIRFVTEPRYFQLFLNSLIMGGSIMAFTILAGFFIALLMMSNIKGKTLFRTVWYIPCVVSMAVVSELISTILNPNSGVINVLLMNAGKDAIMWQLSTFWMFFWIILVSIWKGLGGTIILFMAGMSGIPQELYEAGNIDGTNRFQRLIYITLPCLRQMSAFILITSAMGVFSIFEQVQLISKGGPIGSTKVIMYQIYDEAFLNFNVGISSALSVVVLLLVFIVTIVNMKVTNINLKGDKS